MLRPIAKLRFGPSDVALHLRPLPSAAPRRGVPLDRSDVQAVSLAMRLMEVSTVVLPFYRL